MMKYPDLDFLFSAGTRVYTLFMLVNIQSLLIDDSSWIIQYYCPFTYDVITLHTIYVF